MEGGDLGFIELSDKCQLRRGYGFRANDSDRPVEFQARKPMFYFSVKKGKKETYHHRYF